MIVLDLLWLLILGKYLGVPVHQKKVKTSTYMFVVDKVKQRLTDWKSHSLSFVDRNVLIKSIVQTILNHVMQTSLSPYICCNEFDQSALNFIWGSNHERSGTFTVN